MGLFIPAIWKAINDRLSGDSTLVALLANGSANSITCFLPTPANDANAAYPWVVYKLDQHFPDDAFQTRVHTLRFEVHLYVQERPPSSVSADPMILLAKIHERVLGDWANQSGAPSYGLDRFVPDPSSYTGDAATDYTPDLIVYSEAGTSDLSESGLLHWAMTFEVHMSKVKP